MSKKIKESEFVLENGESIIVPYECFKKFDDSNGECNFIIKDNGGIRYKRTCGVNTINPLQRLNYHNDITKIYIKYDDNTENIIRPNWYYENDYDIPQNNQYQKSELLSFNELHISISKNNYTLSLSEVFDLNDRAVVEGVNSKEIFRIKDGRITSVNPIAITQEFVNDRYIIVS